MSLVPYTNIHSTEIKNKANIKVTTKKETNILQMKLPRTDAIPTGYHQYYFDQEEKYIYEKIQHLRQTKDENSPLIVTPNPTQTHTITFIQLNDFLIKQLSYEIWLLEEYVDTALDPPSDKAKYRWIGNLYANDYPTRGSKPTLNEHNHRRSRNNRHDSHRRRTIHDQRHHSKNILIKKRIMS